MKNKPLLALLALALMAGCAQKGPRDAQDAALLPQYAEFTLNTDLSHLSERQRDMLVLLIEAAEIMDQLFWQQSYGAPQALLEGVEDPALRALIEVNYGPWDRLNGDAPVSPAYGPKPLGAQFYPADMSKAEFESLALPDKAGLYTLLKRNAAGEVVTVPYHEAYWPQVFEAASLLRQAAALAEDAQFAEYLRLRAEALLNDEYMASDLAWMDMKNNPIDLIIGPIETYEDQLFGYKTAYEAYVLIKDQAWSQRLARYTRLLPMLQKQLPVPDQFKAESPGSDSDLNAYDVIYYAGHCNAGSKTIAVNLPNDEQVQLQKGTRRSQLKNAMRAKFDKILVPIADVLVVPEQRKHITFNAFFTNTMFHEVAHGLGIKNTVNGRGPVRTALKEHASAQEEGKADILGLFMVEQLHRIGELEEGELMDYYVTFMAGIFRSVRFGSSSAHGVANLLRFNYFADHGGFNYDAETGLYSVDPDNMSAAVQSLSNKILLLQGSGDYAGVQQWLDQKGRISDQLATALERINAENIPVDIVFRQGIEVLGLTH